MVYRCFYSVLKELDQEMREEIKLVRQMGTKRDEITAYKIMIEEQEYVKQLNEVSTHQCSFPFLIHAS